MANLITDFHELSKLQRSDFHLDMSRSDMVSYLREYVEEQKEELLLNGFQLRLTLPETPISVMLDKRRFNRVLGNLLANALIYNPKGTCLSVSLEKCDNYIQLGVADDGVVITDELAEQLFTPFITGNPARTTGGGSGLGLAIVKELVEKHGGTITLDRSPQEGLTKVFLITLPIVNP